MSRIRITGGKGVHIEFDNGYTLSIQFGPGNYCYNYNMIIGDEDHAAGKNGSTTAEIAVWKGDGVLLEMPGGDTVLGHVPVNEVIDWINKVRALPGAPK